MLKQPLQRQEIPILVSNGNNSLKQWGKTRVGDKLVTLLFKELIASYPKHKQQSQKKVGI